MEHYDASMSQRDEATNDMGGNDTDTDLTAVYNPLPRSFILQTELSSTLRPQRPPLQRGDANDDNDPFAGVRPARPRRHGHPDSDASRRANTVGVSRRPSHRVWLDGHTAPHTRTADAMPTTSSIVSQSLTKPQSPVRSRRAGHGLVSRLSNTKMKTLGLLHPEPTLTYDMCRPLHSLWLQYAHALLGSASSCSTSAPLSQPNANNVNAHPHCVRTDGDDGDSGLRSKSRSSAQTPCMPSVDQLKTHCTALATADLHGAVIAVVRSRTPSYIALQGICVEESEATLRIISMDNRIRTVIKTGTVFGISVGPVTYNLFGTALAHRCAQRSKLKLKGRTTVEIT